MLWRGRRPDQRTKFTGKTEPGPDGIFGYSSIVQTPLDGGGFHVIAQDLVYRMERDHISAIAVLQVSEN